MRIIYCRIAFMKHYNGPSADDKPLYGGAYNKTNTGHEVHNFHANNANYYGFFQPGSNKRSKKDWNDVNVGNITELLGKALKNRSEDEYRFYNVKANIVDCRLLPVEKRILKLREWAMQITGMEKKQRIRKF